MATLDEFDQNVLAAFSQQPASGTDAHIYCEKLKLSNEGWKIALEKLHEATVSGKSDYIKFWALEILFYTMTHFYRDFPYPDKIQIRNSMMFYVRDLLPNYPIATFLKGKLSSIFVQLIKYDFPNPWATFFRDFRGIIPALENDTAIEPLELYLRLLLSLEEDVIQSQHAFSALRDNQTSMTIKDEMRKGAVDEIVGTIYNVLVAFSSQQRMLQAQKDPVSAGRYHQVLTQSLKLLAIYVSWVELDLVANDKFFPFLYTMLNFNAPCVQVACVELIKAVCAKGMDPAKRLWLYGRIDVYRLFTQYDFLNNLVIQQKTGNTLKRPANELPPLTATGNALMSYEDLFAKYYNQDTNPQFNFTSTTEDFACAFAALMNTICLNLSIAYLTSIQPFISGYQSSSATGGKKRAGLNGIFHKSKPTGEEMAAAAVAAASNNNNNNNAIDTKPRGFKTYSEWIALLPEAQQIEVYEISILLLTTVPMLLSTFNNVNFEVSQQCTESMNEIISILRHPGVFDEQYMLAHRVHIQKDFASGRFSKEHFLYHFGEHLPYALHCPGPLLEANNTLLTIICSLTGQPIPPQSQQDQQLLALSYQAQPNAQTPFTYNPATIPPHPAVPSPGFVNIKQEIIVAFLTKLINAYQYPTWYSHSLHDDRETAFEDYRSSTLDRIMRTVAIIDLQMIFYFIHRHGFTLLILLKSLVHFATRGTGSINMASNLLTMQSYTYFPVNYTPTLMAPGATLGKEVDNKDNNNNIINNNTTIGGTPTKAERSSSSIDTPSLLHPLETPQFPSTFNIRSFLPAQVLQLQKQMGVNTSMHGPLSLPLQEMPQNPAMSLTFTPLEPSAVQSAILPKDDITPFITPLLTPFEALYRLLTLVICFSPDISGKLIDILPHAPIFIMLMANPVFAFIPTTYGGTISTTLPQILPSQWYKPTTLRTNIDPYCASEFELTLVKPTSYFAFVQKYCLSFLSYPQFINNVFSNMLIPKLASANALKLAISHLAKGGHITHPIKQFWDIPALLTNLSAIIERVICRPIEVNDKHLNTSSICIDYLQQQVLGGQGPVLSHNIVPEPDAYAEDNPVDVAMHFCECVPKLAHKSYSGQNSVGYLCQMLTIPANAIHTLIQRSGLDGPQKEQFKTKVELIDTFAKRVAECIHALCSLLKDIPLKDLYDPTTLHTPQHGEQLKSALFESLGLCLQAYLLSNNHNLVRGKIIILLHCLLGLLHEDLLPVLVPVMTTLTLTWDKYTFSNTVQLLQQIMKLPRVQTGNGLVYAAFCQLSVIIFPALHAAVRSYEYINDTCFNVLRQQYQEYLHLQQQTGSTTPYVLQLPHELTSQRAERDALHKLYCFFLRDLCSCNLFYVFEYQPNVSPPLHLPSNFISMQVLTNPNKQLSLQTLQQASQFPTLNAAIVKVYELIQSNQNWLNLLTEPKDYRVFYYESLNHISKIINTTREFGTVLPSHGDSSILKLAIQVSKLMLQMTYRIDMNHYQHGRHLQANAYNAIYQRCQNEISTITDEEANQLINYQIIAPSPHGTMFTQISSPYFENKHELLTQQINDPMLNKVLPFINPALPQLHDILAKTLTPAILCVSFLTPDLITTLRSGLGINNPIVNAPRDPSSRQLIQPSVTSSVCFFNINDTFTSILSREILGYIRLLATLDTPYFMNMIGTILQPIIPPQEQHNINQFLQNVLHRATDTDSGRYLDSLVPLFKTLITCNHAALGQ